MGKTVTINFYDKKEKQDLYNFLKTLKGSYRITIHPTTGFDYKTRYKYYFGHILKAIEQAEIFVDNATGEVLSTERIHEQMKFLFNPNIVVNQKNNSLTIVGGSTTSMNDAEFIEEFEEQVLMLFSQPPYYIDFKDRTEWINERKKYHKNLKTNNEG